jgi:hypothetical protein
LEAAVHGVLLEFQLDGLSFRCCFAIVGVFARKPGLKLFVLAADKFQGLGHDVGRVRIKELVLPHGLAHYLGVLDSSWTQSGGPADSHRYRSEPTTASSKKEIRVWIGEDKATACSVAKGSKGQGACLSGEF